MRISELFNLNKNQPSLDFVDVDTDNDVPLFIDPRAFLLLPSDWGHECIALIREFFSILLAAIHDNDDTTGLSLLRNLKEPKETHLGFSAFGTRGRGVGVERSEDLWESLKTSEAVQTGLVEDLEDTILMVPNIGPDIISDITTNIIREALIEYTQAACQVYDIPMQTDIPSGPLWNPMTNAWTSNYVNLPIVNHSKIILVPKVIVRYQMTYDAGEYYRHYLLEELRQDELTRNSSLVEVLVSGKRRVTKKALIEKYGTGKSVLVTETLRHPNALRRYRYEKASPNPPLSHFEMMRDPLKDSLDWDALISNIVRLEPGQANAHKYEAAIQALLYALFYPALVYPEAQFKIHEGRKRIDITFTNSATDGFFLWLATNYRAPLIFVECKNYGGEIANPELDQLAGRFSPNRGRCGIIVCRSFDNKDLFLQRCRDTAQDDRGFIIALDDSDLVTLANQRKAADSDMGFSLLYDRFKHLIK